MKSIASSIVVVAAAWLWQTTAGLYMLPGGSNDFIIMFSGAMALTAFVLGLRGFFEKPERKKERPPSWSFIPEAAPLPPQSPKPVPPAAKSNEPY
jgi:hypothetical protein